MGPLPIKLMLNEKKDSAKCFFLIISGINIPILTPQYAKTSYKYGNSTYWSFE